ncbi:PadR family transcriptional regulator [Actinoallomurus vinaceus]|uniref:PadR family transcriptional regulator n=1 Tax=Actinoallomurus vinaceus TaxID=1080074 RepID=A0ABP8UD05_9ACTN
MSENFAPLRRITVPTLAVLAVLLREDHRWFGLRIAEELGMRTASVYPILARLEKAGWVTATWEVPSATHDSGAPRKYYALTEPGRESAKAVLAAREEVMARHQRSASLLSRAGYGH